jgi:hypothetical protein
MFQSLMMSLFITFSMVKILIYHKKYIISHALIGDNQDDVQAHKIKKRQIIHLSLNYS